jgi:hypothetical protein
LRATSAAIVIASLMRFDSDSRSSVAPSASAPAAIVAPSNSIWRAISVALRVFVPLVSTLATMSAVPALPTGSAALPDMTRSWALMIGRSRLETTITRSPLASVFSAGAGNFADTAGPAAGGFTRSASGASVVILISDFGMSSFCAWIVLADLISSDFASFGFPSCDR